MAKQVFLRGSVRELASSSVASLLGAGLMARIQQTDANPYFFELTLAHEGRSTGEIVGLGNRVKEWARRVIRAVARAFNPAGRVPARIYDGLIHWHNNEAERLPVGEVVHSRVIELAGVEHVQAIGWVYPDQGDLRTAINQGQRDCCSIEADVLMHEENGRTVVDDVERATAVVLGHTSRQLPGFPGAIIRKLSEFEPTETPGSTTGDTGAGGGPVSSPPPAVPAAVTPAAPSATPAGGATTQPLSREQVIAEAKRLGLTAAELSLTPPAPTMPASLPAPVPAPPEQPASAPINQWDLTSPDVNPFLPK